MYRYQGFVDGTKDCTYSNGQKWYTTDACPSKIYYYKQVDSYYGTDYYYSDDANLSDYNMDGRTYTIMATYTLSSSPNTVSINNYVCLDNNNCVNNTDLMYRIIGVTSSGQLKLIKKESLNEGYEWYSSASKVPWTSSTANSYINGAGFLNNTTYIPSGWSSYIASTTWKHGYLASLDEETGVQVYNLEQALTSSTSAKVSLQYISDYFLAGTSNHKCNAGFGQDGTECTLNWLFLSNSDPNPPYSQEWTMVASNTYPYRITGMGFVNFKTASNTVLAVRPTFYLTSSVYYESGTGTETDPYIITKTKPQVPTHVGGNSD